MTNTRTKEFGKRKSTSNVVGSVKNNNKIYTFNVENVDNRGNIQTYLIFGCLI